METLSEENYLKTIYILGKQCNDKVTITALASALGNNPASVVDMLKKLTEKKLIEYDKFSGAKLNETGNKIALLVIRRHRLWELFLQSKLGYTWDEVHAIAEQLEHVHHDELADRLEEFLGFPKFDPHGDPIPDKNGNYFELESYPLAIYQPTGYGVVIGLANMSPVFLQYLDKLGIHLGTKIKVLEKNAFDHSLDIKIDGKVKIHLSQQTAQNILLGKI